MTQFNHLREKLVVAASYHKPRHCSLKSMAKRPVFCYFCFFGGGSEIQIKDGPGSSRQWPRYCLKPVQQPNT